MSKDSSFDIVSDVDLNEVDNALNMSVKEIQTRFDFKGSHCSIERQDLLINLVAEDEMKLKNVRSIIEDKFARRQIPIGFLDYQKVESSLGGNVKQQVRILKGIDKDTARNINKFIKSLKRKVNTQIQEQHIRVFSPKKDELQSVIASLKQEDFGIVLQFTNYR